MSSQYWGGKGEGDECEWRNGALTTLKMNTKRAYKMHHQTQTARLGGKKHKKCFKLDENLKIFF